MRKVRRYYYECEFCGSRYETEEEARKCEDSHKKPIKIIETGFRYFAPDDEHGGFYDDNAFCNGWPHEIEVDDNLGNRGYYKYEFDRNKEKLTLYKKYNK